MADFRNYINPQPKKGRFSEAWQKEAVPDGEDYVEDKSGKIVDALIQSVRKGSIVRVRRLFCLAPWAGGPAKRRRVMAERVDAIRERGGVIMEAETQRRSDVRGHCGQMLMGGYEDIATSGRGIARYERTGRPPKYKMDSHELAIAEGVWTSRRYKNDDERLIAIEKRTGKKPGRTWLRNKFGSPHKSGEE